MTRRTLQIWWNETLPMAPVREVVASSLVQRASRDIPQRAQLVRMADRVIAVGGGKLVEVDVTRPAEAWHERDVNVLYPTNAADVGTPLLIGTGGEVFSIQPDLSLATVWERGIDAALPIGNGWTVLHPARRVLFGNWLIDANRAIKWRLRSDMYIRVALEDVMLSVIDGRQLECRSTETGDVRWVRDSGSPKVVVDDTVWIVDGTSLVACGLDRGEERARIAVHKVAADLVVDADGRGHVLARGLYWTIDLRTARVLTRYEITDPPRDVYTVLPLEDGLLMRTSEHALYRLEPRDGTGALPPPLWRSPVLISQTVPFQNGLVVKTDAHTGQAVHWLAPA